MFMGSIAIIDLLRTVEDNDVIMAGCAYFNGVTWIIYRRMDG